MVPDQEHSALCDFIRSLYPGQAVIPLHEPRFRGREREYVLEAIDSGYVSSVGSFVNRLEQMVCTYTGAAYAVATVNGTAALHLALQVVGVQPGNLVITQPLTFVATCHAISYLQAEPLFLDIDRHTLGLSAEALVHFLQTECEQKEGGCYHRNTGKRIGACVPVHTFGHPAQLDALSLLCDQYAIPMVEDAAESLGSTFKGRHTGTWGEVGVYSFNGNKTITTGGGGMLVTHNKALAERAKHVSTQAKVGHPWASVHNELGYNYRMPNLNAALGCAQLEQLESIVGEQRNIAAAYKNFIASCPGLEWLEEPRQARSNYWLPAVLCENKAQRDLILAECHSQGIQARPAWELMHRLPVYQHCIRTALPVSEDIADRIINLPGSIPAHANT
jgi:perosamine synthetase